MDYARLTVAEIVQHTKIANFHAVEVLRIARRVVMYRSPGVDDHIRATRDLLGGSAIFIAIDIITAVGQVGDVLANRSTIITLIYSGLELLNTLSEY